MIFAFTDNKVQSYQNSYIIRVMEKNVYKRQKRIENYDNFIGLEIYTDNCIRWPDSHALNACS